MTFQLPLVCLNYISTAVAFQNPVTVMLSTGSYISKIRLKEHHQRTTAVDNPWWCSKAKGKAFFMLVLLLKLYNNKLSRVVCQNAMKLRLHLEADTAAHTTNWQRERRRLKYTGLGSLTRTRYNWSGRGRQSLWTEMKQERKCEARWDQSILIPRSSEIVFFVTDLAVTSRHWS